MEKLKMKKLPEGAVVSLIVSEDTKFKTGRFSEFPADSPDAAVKAYEEIALDAKGIAGIGYQVIFDRKGPYVSTKAFFYPEGDPLSEPCNFPELCFEEVYAAVKGVMDIISVITRKVSVFARISMSLEMPVAAYDALRKKSVDRHGRYTDLVLDADLIREFLDHGFVEDDSYVPNDVFESIDCDLAERLGKGGCS